MTKTLNNTALRIVSLLGNTTIATLLGLTTAVAIFRI
jgi:hypothetical protein